MDHVTTIADDPAARLGAEVNDGAAKGRTDSAQGWCEAR